MITGVNVGDDNALPLSILHKSFVIFDNDFDRGNQADKEMSFLTPAFQTGRLRWQIWWFPWLIFLETGNRWFTHSGGGLCQGKSMATNMKSKYHYQCQGVPMSARISRIQYGLGLGFFAAPGLLIILVLWQDCSHPSLKGVPFLTGMLLSLPRNMFCLEILLAP